MRNPSLLLRSSPSPQVVSQGRAAAEGELVVMPNLDGVQVGLLSLLSLSNIP